MRHILKLHRSLAEAIPSSTHLLQITTFNPAIDKEEWLALNNKIFAHHPDQGNWVAQDLESRMSEPWFDPQGFFLARIDGKICAFVWTKIHNDHASVGPIGELYVVGVDPDHAGAGIGKAISLYAMKYLRDSGITQSMLYVDADNEAGLALYTHLGFN